MEHIPPDFEAPFPIIAETASDAIITIDERSTILFVNAAAERIFGYSISEMLGQPMMMLMPEYLRFVHEVGLRRYIETGQRHISWQGMELPGLRKDGRTVALEISFGEFKLNGRRLFTGIARDITQRKHRQRLRSAYIAAVRVLAEHPSSESVLAETLSAICGALEWKVGILWNADSVANVLRQTASWCERDELTEFVRHSADFTFSKGVGLPGRVWTTNQAAWILRLRDDPNFPRRDLASQFELISGAAFPVIADHEVIAVMEFFSTDIQPPDQELLDTFMTIGHQMGQYMEHRNAEEALAKSETQLRHLVASEKEARREAEAANRMKDEFLAILSHELRTPLTSVFGWVQMLQNRATDPEITAKALNVIDRNLRVQAKLIEDLLNVSQIITGKLQIQRDTIDAVQIVMATIETIRPSADAKQITLKLESDRPLPALSADPARLQQIVWNLLSNSVKFTPKGGSVIVNVRQSGSELEIAVSDTGEGISPEFLPQVFNRFSQADASKTRRHSGLGLGLALVRQLIELHGGTVRVASPGVGKGSTFTVSFPLPPISTSSPKPNTFTTKSSDTSPLQDVRVLLVEDEPDTREMIAHALQEFGASVAQASSAAEAFREFVSTTPDILVSDIGMPDADGYQLLAMIRAQAPEPPPAVAITAYATAAEKEHALRSGFQAHLSKPVELSKLVSVIAGLVRRTDY
ncbi:MAG: hypothetical protein DMG15_11695 [Acidobacteria bacterium]|nr:MAG: hypothetical protein DMG15_11695 [Acidobacteriota bacterium]